MDCLSKVMNLVQQGDWAISIDLKDAYFHIPIHPAHKKYLRFYIQGKAFQFTCLCFGPTVTPRSFTKVVAVIHVAAYLRVQNLRLAVYLDDWFLVNQIKTFLMADKEKSLSLLVKLGFLVNIEKSTLCPSQTITYIGAVFLLNKGMVSPTLERILKIEQAIFLIKREPTAQNFLHLLELMASCIELVPHALLFMRPVQLHLLHYWRPDKRSPSHNTSKQTLGKSFELVAKQGQSIVGKTIPSATKYESIDNRCLKTRLWRSFGKPDLSGHLVSTTEDIAYKLPRVGGSISISPTFPSSVERPECTHNFIRSDNTTVVQYINKQGGTRSPRLCYQAWDLWKMAIKNRIMLTAAHLSGTQNILADDLSRLQIRPTEWILNNAVVSEIFHLWGTPMVDLFASEENRKAKIFCSWIPSHLALATDTLSVSRENMEAYAFPPICLIPKVLQHMKRFQCQLILISGESQ